jgi:hypothetical protein
MPAGTGPCAAVPAAVHHHSSTAGVAVACSAAPDVVMLMWQEPLEKLVTSHGVITRRRADSEWATQPLRSRSQTQLCTV